MQQNKQPAATQGSSNIQNLTQNLVAQNNQVTTNQNVNVQNLTQNLVPQNKQPATTQGPTAIQNLTQNLVAQNTATNQANTNVQGLTQNILAQNKQGSQKSIPNITQQAAAGGVSMGIAQMITKNITDIRQTPNQYNQIALLPENQIVATTLNANVNQKPE